MNAGFPLRSNFAPQSPDPPCRGFETASSALSRYTAEQFVFGNVVPKADAGQDVIEGSLGNFPVCRDRDMVLPEMRLLAKPNVAAALPESLVAERGKKLDEVGATNRRELWHEPR